MCAVKRLTQQYTQMMTIWTDIRIDPRIWDTRKCLHINQVTESDHSISLVASDDKNRLLKRWGIYILAWSHHRFLFVKAMSMAMALTCWYYNQSKLGIFNLQTAAPSMVRGHNSTQAMATYETVNLHSSRRTTNSYIFLC